jgi:ribosomal subunit interface protein
MKNTISVRHCEIPEELRDRADGVLTRVARHSVHALEGTAVFDQGPLHATVELRLHVRRGRVLVGIGEAPDHRTALDRAEEKLRRQLDRSSTEARQARRSSPRA